MRPLIHGRQLPLEYWAEAALTAAYLRNRSPSAAIGGITPYELWHGTVPDLSHLRVFGCLAFSMLSDKAREHSLSVRSKVGVFVGYDKVQKGYRIHFPDTGELVVTRNVGFHEDKAYDFSTLPQSPEPTADIPNTTTDTAARPPGVRPRLVVIGPRRPADVLPPAEVEIDAFDTVPASYQQSVHLRHRRRQQPDRVPQNPRQQQHLLPLTVAPVLGQNQPYRSRFRLGHMRADKKPGAISVKRPRVRYSPSTTRLPWHSKSSSLPTASR
ncbi:unnamed protein product [Tilletia caries]|nr:unnamed protein product [Tilletia caries]